MKQPVFVFLLFFLSVLVSSLGHGQGQLDYLFKMSLEDLLKVKVVGSTLTPQSLKKVPSAVTIFTHEEISRMGFDTLDELMQLVPGFQSYRTSETALSHTYSARSRRIGGTSSEILLLLDGQRLNEPNNSGSVFIIPKLPLNIIERVEFIRGPGAAIYGSGAMLGVINIISRTSINEIEVAYGHLNRRRTYLQNSQQSAQINIHMSAYLEADDGEAYRLLDTFGPNHINTDDPKNIGQLNVKFQWQETQLNIFHYQYKARHFYQFDGISNNFNANNGEFNSLWINHSFNWQKIKSSFRLGYHKTKLTINAQLTPSGYFSTVSTPTSNDPLFTKTNFSNASETRLLWHNQWEIDDTRNLQFGLELAYIDTPSFTVNNNFDIADLADGLPTIRYYGDLSNSTTFLNKSTRTIAGLYSQYQQQLREFTHLTLGLRFDHFSAIGSQLSPRLGLVHEFTRNHSLKLLYGQAFRAPTEEELNLNKNSVLIMGNPQLKPETVQTSELIWVGQWQYAGFSLGYFESHFKNSILQSELVPGSYKFQNSKQAPIKGAEFEYSLQWHEDWLLRASYTHISEQPDLSFRESEQLASLALNYQQANWNANLMSTWQGERQMPVGNDEQNLITLADYWLISGKITYTFNKGLEGFVQIKNALNEDYRTPAFGSALNEGVSNRGREILTGISWQY